MWKDLKREMWVYLLHPESNYNPNYFNLKWQARDSKLEQLIIM